MKPFGTLLPFPEAKKLVDDNIQPLTRVEKVDLDDALGRVLADDLVATLNIPSADRAAMDGYAVRARDTLNAGQFNPRLLNLIGELHAGKLSPQKVGDGECLQIATGAMIPAGADAVVMVEDTDIENDRVKIFKAAHPGVNVARKAEDIKKGEVVLRQGTVLDAGKIGVLASQGIQQVTVYDKPKVAIIPTGEEIYEVGRNLKPGQVYDINSHTMTSVVKINGGIPIRFGIAGDDASQLKKTIAEATRNDLVVISGGSSVGEKDLLASVLQDMGEVLFHGVQVKPGKPTIFALVNGKPLLGMPGYPTSCLINGYLFVMPAVRKMARLPLVVKTVEARLGQKVTGGGGRRLFLTVRLEQGEVIPVFKESGAITSIAEAEGYIEIPENIDLLEKGEPVTVTLF